MDMDSISVFVKVVESGSFSAAARLLKMPKTTVSGKIAALEKRLGVTLIQRTTRKLHVTTAGQTYFRHCVLAVRELEQAEAELFADQGTPRGVLRITAPADLGHSLLPRIMCEYLKRHPDVEVEMIVTNRIVDLVGEGVDLAIRAGALKDSTLVAKKFFDIRACFWATPAYLKKFGVPQHPQDLQNHSLIAHSLLRGGGNELTDGRSTVRLTAKPRIRADDFETIKSLILLKEGTGLLPEFLVARESKSKDLVPVLPKWTVRDSGSFSFVYPGQKYASPKVRALIDLALELKDELQL